MTTYAQLVTGEEALVAYWRLGERDGSTAADARGRHHGTYRHVTLGQPGAIDEDDTAAGFDGELSAVLIGDSPDFAFEGDSPFTIEAWTKLDREPVGHLRVLSRRLDDETGTYGYELVLTVGRRVTFNRHAGDAVDHAATRRAVEVGEWAQIVAVFDGEWLRAYINGEAAAATVGGVRLGGLPAPLDIGRRSGSSGTSTFSGSIDDVSITARALSDEDVGTRFAAALTSARLGERRGRGAQPAPRDTTVRPERMDLGSADDDRWAATASRLLAEPLFDRQYVADVADHLLVPVHAAFELQREPWIADFADHASRLAAAYGSLVSASGEGAICTQYLYLWSRFTALAYGAGRAALVPDPLSTLLVAELGARWRSAESVLESKLARGPAVIGAERAINDDELCLIGIGADLLSTEAFGGSEHVAMLRETRELAVRLLASEIRWAEDGSWVFQPGVEQDGLAPQTNRAQRLALVLESLRGAFGEDDPRRRFVDHLRTGLERRFIERILVAGDTPGGAPWTRRFMDGDDDDRAGAGALLLGLWSRLPGARVRAVYQGLADMFPLAPEVIAGYVQPARAGARTRHELCAEPASYSNGLRELLVRLAAATEGPPAADHGP